MDRKTKVLGVILLLVLLLFSFKAAKANYGNNPYLKSFDENGALVVWENPPPELCGSQYHKAVLVVGNVLPSEQDWWAWTLQSPCMWVDGVKEIHWRWSSYLNNPGIFYPKKSYILDQDGQTLATVNIGEPVYYVNWATVYLPMLTK